MPEPKTDAQVQLELAKLDLEREKIKIQRSGQQIDLLKWMVFAGGAIISFAVVDYGNLLLAESRADAEHQRALLQAYLSATESPTPDVWRRKLHLILNSSPDARTASWAERELQYIDEFAALNSLYRETLRVASQLVNPNTLDEPDRVEARARYEQLYWADLPYAGESSEVEAAMVLFRMHLLEAERDGSDVEAWTQLNYQLINLSEALRDSTPNDPLSE